MKKNLPTYFLRPTVSDSPAPLRRSSQGAARAASLGITPRVVSTHDSVAMKQSAMADSRSANTVNKVNSNKRRRVDVAPETDAQLNDRTSVRRLGSAERWVKKALETTSITNNAVGGSVRPYQCRRQLRRIVLLLFFILSKILICYWSSHPLHVEHK